MHLCNSGPFKPSESPDQSVLQTSSASLGFPKGILQRHALSLGSGARKGFGRDSPAGGVLDHLQMPNRPGLKFPSRDFGRISSKTLSAAPLSPKPSLSKSKAASPRAASPAAAAPATAAAPLPPKAAASEAATAPAEAVAVEEVSQPEPKRLPHSRFTEEYLSPVVLDRRAEPSRAELIRASEPQQPSQRPVEMAEAETQYSDDSALSEAESEAEPSEPVTVETQTSMAIGQIQSDPSLPLHGFRRHMSLRHPEVLLQPRLGRPTADDIITTAHPHVAELQRRATTDFMLDATKEEPEPVGVSDPDASAEQVFVEIDKAAPALESPVDLTPTAVVAGSADDNELYESDFVSDLVKTLSSAAADEY